MQHMDYIDNNLMQRIKHIHFIGIGGSGMYPLAQILSTRGFLLTGSDNNETDTLKAVRDMGIRVTLGHYPENVDGAELVVYTAAIMKDNPELNAAIDKGIPTVERSVMLGYITRCFKTPIGVCGTHGKTTTSAMITHVLMESGFDPSAVIGGKLKTIGGSGRVGASDLLVCEACEFVDTFLKMDSAISLILNIDEDHLDYFKNLDNIIASFRKFAEKTTRTLVVNGDDVNTMRAVDGLDKEIIPFGRGDANRYRAENVRLSGKGSYSYELVVDNENICTVVLTVPGEHNVMNSLGAAAVLRALGVPFADICAGIRSFMGAGRRFEVLGVVNGVTVVDDYAHHPKELEVTLNAAMQMGYSRVWAVFQPFTYSRTALLLNDFVRVLQIPDFCVMTEIMGSREKNTYGIYTAQLSEQIPGAVWFNTFEEIADYVMSRAQPGDLVITLGCGDVYKIAKIMVHA